MAFAISAFWVILLVVSLTPWSPAEGRQLQVYHQPLTTEKYLYQGGLPQMSELTICFWLKLRPREDRVDDYLLSLSLPDNHNELLIGWDSNGVMVFVIQHTFTDLPTPIDVGTFWRGWNKHCFTWRKGTSIKWYTQKFKNGRLEMVASATPQTSDHIRAGGHLVLLQDQDIVDGDFDIDQTVPGQIAEFNFWNREMTDTELNSETCGVLGNVSSWKTLKEKGKSLRSEKEFPDCIAK